MTTAQDLHATPTTAQDSSERCAVCAHDLTRHDSVALRFCQATEARALTRPCLCAKTA